MQKDGHSAFDPNGTPQGVPAPMASKSLKAIGFDKLSRVLIVCLDDYSDTVGFITRPFGTDVRSRDKSIRKNKKWLLYTSYQFLLYTRD